MTTLYVDNIAPNLQSKISAPNLTLPSGSVLQKVIKQSPNNQTINSTSFTGVTSLTVSITPKIANSRLLVSVYLPAVYLEATGRHVYWTVFRDVSGGGYTNIGLGTGNLANNALGLSSGNTSGGNQWTNLAAFVEDTGRSNSTATHSYRVYIKNNSAGQIQYISEGNSTQSIIVEEIAQ